MDRLVEQTEPTAARLEATVDRVERSVALLLRGGTVAASLLTGAGLAAVLLQPDQGLGTSLVTAGLLTLVATPLLRVVAALFLYVQAKDHTYALISLTVVAIVLAGVLMGQTH